MKGPTIDGVGAEGCPGGLRGELLDAAVRAGVKASLKVHGNSMLPFLQSGDLAQIRPVAEQPPEAGDIVATRIASSSGLLVHRVVKRLGDQVVVCGDNCQAVDGLFGGDQVLGIVTRVERNGRSVWFGAGWSGPAVGWAVRHGLIWRFNRLYYGLRRRACRALKFLGADSRLPAQKGDDGNE